ncbi:MAG: gliding motility-associated C-terminal domain-containing protein [Saprospiraceae bacterium]
MKDILYKTLFALLVFASQNLNAQFIARSTFCATGPTWSNGAGILTTTFGQCPGCTTLSSNSNFLTQGFQQPSNEPCLIVGIDFLETTDNCGTVYDFSFTGNANVDEAEFKWNFGPNGFPQTSNLPNPQGVSFTSTGIVFLSLQVTEGDCSQQSIISIDVPSTAFSTYAIPYPVNCKNGDDGYIEIKTTGGVAPLTYAWSTGQQTDFLDNLSAGDYSYTVTDNNGCEATNVVTLSEPDGLQADVIITNETCKGDLDGSIEVTISGGTAPYNLQWNNGEVTASQSGLTSGDYALTITDADDCVGEFIWSLGLSCDLRIEDVLSPDGDGINETWIVTGIDQFPDNEVSIFNRWGQQVWQTTAYANDWSGTNEDGEPLPIGAYFYVLKLNDPEDQIFSGSITLVR